jgi:ActR/RegA family two-component response regulator
MAHLAGLIVTDDDVLRKHVGRLLRTGAVPVGVIDQSARGEGAAPPDVIVVDIRLDPSSGMAAIERLRGWRVHLRRGRVERTRHHPELHAGGRE